MAEVSNQDQAKLRYEISQFFKAENNFGRRLASRQGFADIRRRSNGAVGTSGDTFRAMDEREMLKKATVVI